MVKKPAVDFRLCKNRVVRKKEVRGGFRNEIYCPKIGKVINSFGMAEYCHYSEE